jgi:hypothetical protein
MGRGCGTGSGDSPPGFPPVWLHNRVEELREEKDVAHVVLAKE